MPLLSETAFKTDFGPREVPQSESESAGFCGLGTFCGPKSFLKPVSLKSAHIGFAFIRNDQVHNMGNGQGIYAGLIRGNNIDDNKFPINKSQNSIGRTKTSKCRVNTPT